MTRSAPPQVGSSKYKTGVSNEFLAGLKVFALLLAVIAASTVVAGLIT
jgi:hypothetical protein